LPKTEVLIPEPSVTLLNDSYHRIMHCLQTSDKIVCQDSTLEFVNLTEKVSKFNQISLLQKHLESKEFDVQDLKSKLESASKSLASSERKIDRLKLLKTPKVSENDPEAEATKTEKKDENIDLIENQKYVEVLAISDERLEEINRLKRQVTEFDMAFQKTQIEVLIF
jgi:hypothetical protein